MKTAALLCANGAPLLLPAAIAGVSDVTVADDLCRNPTAIRDAAGEGTDRLVLGLCRGEYALGAVQTQLRGAGFDPLGVPIIELPPNAVPEHLAITIAGAAARAATFAGSGPEHAKLTFPAAVSRRALVTGAARAYVAVPAIDHEICAVDAGCRACVNVCPQQALSWQDGMITHDKVACQPCGRCVTTCPTGATSNPAITPAMVMAQVETIVAAGGESIVFTCERGVAPDGPWHEVRVPCTGMVTAAWLLAPLLRGAAAVSALPCSVTGCPLGHDKIVLDVVDYCTQLLVAMGSAETRVAAEPIDTLPAPLVPQELNDPLGPHGGAEVTLALAAALDSHSVVVEHAAAPSGSITIDPAACTGCTQCAQTCPTDALSLHQGPAGSLTISFDAALCTACGQCIPRCPELERGAISMLPVTDVGALGAGPTQLYSGTAQLCERCGSPIASTDAMDRIRDLLGNEYAATMNVVSTLCIDCRGR